MIRFLPLCLASAMLGAATLADVEAGAASDGRSQLGAHLFRAMLAADMELDKKVDGDGVLRLLIVHAGDADRAASLGDVVAGREGQRAPEPIKDFAVRIDRTKVDELGEAGKKAVAGVFVAEPLRRDQLAAVIRFGAERRVIVYSPFDGDVEKGVSGGLAVEAQVRPFVNTDALQASQIALRESFLKVAKVYPRGNAKP